MKKDFLRFQISKEAMNELRGGAQSCHCGGSNHNFVVNGAESFDDLEKSVGAVCGSAGWACTPMR